jgi:ribosomal subunit interface protein
VEIVITGRRTEVPERFRQQAEEKLAKISQLAPRAHRVDVELSHERNPRQSQICRKVEITVRAKGPVIRAEAQAEESSTALDLAFGKLLERLRRMRDRRKMHHGRHAPGSLRRSAAAEEALMAAADQAALDAAQAPAAVDGSPVEDGAESPVVIRTKDHRAAPMSLDQALYEMELVGHDFFLFVEASSGRPSVVYLRRGWSYGVIRLDVVARDADDTPPDGVAGLPRARSENGSDVGTSVRSQG